MLRPRLIPCLLLHDRGFVKTKRFRAPRYVGDPLNTVRIFSELGADELCLLDIDASRHGAEPNIERLRVITSECFVPFSYGGGITTVEQAAAAVSAGVEKVALNTGALDDPALVTRLAERFGNQAVVGAIDAAREKDGWIVRSKGGRCRHDRDPVSWARELEERGAGEILLNSIDRDGMRSGYDMELIAAVSSAVQVPVIAVGGADTLRDCVAAVLEGGASAVGVGSMFVFWGPLESVLVNYPDRATREGLFAGSRAGKSGPSVNKQAPAGI